MDDFFRFSKNLGFWVFLVHPTVVSVLLSASVERFFVSRMRDFFGWGLKIMKGPKWVIFLKGFLKVGPLIYTGEQNCVCWASGKGASQLLESQWGDYSAWVAWGKGKVETGKASQGAQLSLSSRQPRQSSPPTVTLGARGLPCLRPTLSPSGL